MYRLMAIISLFIRQCYLPNPFENTPYPVLINWICEPFLHGLTYEIVGLFYKRRSSPAIGAFLYLLFYAINTALLYLIIYLGYKSIASIIIVVIYFIILIIARIVKKTLEDITS